MQKMNFSENVNTCMSLLLKLGLKFYMMLIASCIGSRGYGAKKLIQLS